MLNTLTKREYLLRQFYKINNKNYIYVPKNYQTNPTNPILQEIKTGVVANPVVEKQTEYYKLKYLDYINLDGKNVTKEIPTYKKSQYKMMRKNISNMVRIQADKAVAMPIDTRIQLLTLSKDIIHS